MYVYKTTNLLTGRRYIGSCTRPINKTKNYFGGNGQLKKDIKEFGRKNFVKEILWQTEDFDELQEMEVRIIKQVNATKDKAWYNVHERYGITNYGTKFSDEHKQKISDSWTYSTERVEALNTPEAKAARRAAERRPEVKAARSKAQKAAMTKEARQNLTDKLKGREVIRAKHPGISKMKDNYWRARHGTKHLGSSKDYDKAVKLRKDYINQLNKGK
jgi:group I intron endonuclease